MNDKEFDQRKHELILQFEKASPEKQMEAFNLVLRKLAEIVRRRAAEAHTDASLLKQPHIRQLDLKPQ